jgi:hydrogenase maturation protease
MRVVVGLGSPHGDDQLGWIAVDRLQPLLPADSIGHKIGAPIELVDCLHGHETALIIDAAAPASRPGTHRSFLWPCSDLTSGAAWSTHGVGLVEALRLAEALGRLPRRVQIDTIEAGDTTPGAAMSAMVARSLDALVGAILRDLARCDRF